MKQFKVAPSKYYYLLLDTLISDDYELELEYAKYLRDNNIFTIYVKKSNIANNMEIFKFIGLKDDLKKFSKSHYMEFSDDEFNRRLREIDNKEDVIGKYEIEDYIKKLKKKED